MPRQAQRLGTARAARAHIIIIAYKQRARYPLLRIAAHRENMA